MDAANCAFNHCNNMLVVLVQEFYAFVSQSLCFFSWFVSDNVLCDNSQLSLNRQLYRTDTSVKWPPRFGPSLYLLTLYLTL